MLGVILCDTSIYPSLLCLAVTAVDTGRYRSAVAGLMIEVTKALWDRPWKGKRNDCIA